MNTADSPPHPSSQYSYASTRRGNTSEMDGRLITAILNGQPERLERALNAGGDVNAATLEVDETILLLAIKHGQTECARILIERGAHLGTTSAGERPLMMAVRQRREDICRALLDAGAQVNGCDNSRKTALYEAVMSEHPGICRLLIEAGADVHEETRAGSLPLNAIVAKTSPEAEEIVRLLVDAGASPSKLPSPPRAKHAVALSAFQAAVQLGRPRHVEYFLRECGEDPSQTTTDGKTMLEQTSEPVVKNLLRSAMTTSALERALDSGVDSQPSVSRSKGYAPL